MARLGTATARHYPPRADSWYKGGNRHRANGDGCLCSTRGRKHPARFAGRRQWLLLVWEVAMTTSLWIILAVLGVFAAYTLVAPLALNIGRFIGRSWLFCPDRREYAQVRLNAIRGALSSAYGNPHVTVRGCSIRNPGETCDEKCLHGAAF